MKKKPFLERIGDVMAGKGFYIVLFLCVAAIGISGYYLLSSIDFGAGSTSVAGGAQVVVTPAPTKKVPAVKPTPSPTVEPSASPAPAATEKPGKSLTRTVYTWPVKGEVISDFSLEVLAYDQTMGDWRTHSGIDINADQGAPVLAISDGTVESIRQDDLMGTVVTIDHGSGIKSVYANLAAAPAVSKGESVTTGKVIGAVGNTAIAESGRPSHLHFEMNKDGVSVDPAEYLP